MLRSQTLLPLSGMSTKGRMMSILLVLLVSFPTMAMAVDRSKFRRCDQTSFCRRHRNGAHSNMFQYKLVKESVRFHYSSSSSSHEDKKGGEDNEGGKTNDSSNNNSNKNKDTDGSGGGGVWKSLSRTLLGKKEETKSSLKPGEDPYMTGPVATVTGLVKNTKTENEMLNVTITCLHHGMVRVRMTEIYGGGSSPFEHPRVTYDELVLQSDTIHPAGHALLLKDVTTNDKIKKVIGSVDDVGNFIALQYGDISSSAGATKLNNMVLLMQLEPFVVSLYRENDDDLVGPIITLGSEQRIHFEVRRFKQSSASDNEAEPTIAKDEEEGNAGEDATAEGKEIVGYWEDGLAIYADGTREEKKVVDSSSSSAHRHLTEAELDTQGLWEEDFSSHHDTKPYGPMSVGMDISFLNSQHLFGIPEHASSTLLQTTTSANPDINPPHYKEPYRLYNLDVFEYELDETMALYGHVPLIVSQSIATGTVGVFWFNPTETFVEVQKNEGNDDIGAKKMTTHWISESGVIDIFILPGPDPATMYRQYADLTGTTPTPPMFALGYHQCRWNYKDEKDVYMVHSKFEELDYPYDVLWLDIEHTDGKRYFTWDTHNFPNPTTMLDTLAATGRRMVTIIDPHIKRDDNYYIHKEATSKGLYIKDKDGKNDYDGWCWPGSSSYLDFTAAHVRDWWAQQFSYNKYKGSTSTLFTWNDMNEPSVFNGPEVSMQKDLRNLNGVEHREWHNLYGMLFHRATGEGLIQRNPPGNNIRPFVLSRSFFAGSQKYGAIWTGDNCAEWSHLEIAAPMLLSLNVAALSFVGADVGGFFGNPDAELFTRWMQAGAFQPFFRGHAHHDSNRREPWMFDDDTLYRLRKAAMARYALLPYWYTTFHHAETTGMPVMRTMWMEYPKTEALFPIDDQYMIGSDLLVKPITSAGITYTNVLFPTNDIWYDAQTLVRVSTTTTESVNGGVESVTVPADIDTIPVFQRGGSIICRKLRLRRSTVPMKTDPYTLYIALNATHQSFGTLYMDDEETFSYRRTNDYAIATFSADGGNDTKLTLRNAVNVGSGWKDFVDTSLASDRLIERIVVLMPSSQPSPTSVVAVSGSGHGQNTKLDFTYSNDGIVTIRKPSVSALHDWQITIT